MTEPVQAPAAGASPREIVSTRIFGVPPERVFEAFADPARLARWWGPSGFTNAFDEFDFRPGGAWRFTMIGPDGARYPNHSVFAEVAAPRRIVFDHQSAPHHFRMAITLTAQGGQTRVDWRMRFDAAEERDSVVAYVVPANEENFDRLAAELATMQHKEKPMSAKQIYVNLPIKNMERTKAFFASLGFTFNPQFTNEQGACMVVADNIYVMLLVEPFFQTFTKKPIADATKSTEVLVCLSCESRSEVDELVARAKAAGGTVPRPPQDHGFMYGHGFEDLDGHVWELIHMDASAAPPQA